MPKINSNVKENVIQLKEFLRLILPINKQEYILACILMLFYGILGIYIADTTSIQDYELKQCDLYFSFDSGFIYHQAKSYQDSIHPLLKPIFTPIIWVLNSLFVYTGHYKIKTYAIVFMCNIFISMSIIYIYRYMREIINIGNLISLFIVVFYSLFFTNIALSFTVETYTISIFILSYMVYFYSHCIIANKEIKTFTLFIFSFFLGGITISNVVKGIIPVFFSKDKFSKALKKSLCVGFSIIGCILLYILLKNIDIFTEVNTRSQYIPEAEKSNYFVYLFSFIGSSIYFADIHLRPFIAEWINYPLQLIELSLYRSWHQFLFSGIIIILIISSIIYNIKNRYALLILGLFAVDIFIHLVAQYGSSEPYIYGGHWIYIVPLLLGWLYKSLSNVRSKQIFVSIITLLFISLLINNGTLLLHFIRLAQEYYPIHLMST